MGVQITVSHTSHQAAFPIQESAQAVVGICCELNHNPFNSKFPHKGFTLWNTLTHVSLVRPMLSTLLCNFYGFKLIKPAAFYVAKKQTNFQTLLIHDMLLRQH